MGAEGSKLEDGIPNISTTSDAGSPDRPSHSDKERPSPSPLPASPPKIAATPPLPAAKKPPIAKPAESKSWMMSRQEHVAAASPARVSTPSTSSRTSSSTAAQPRRSSTSGSGLMDGSAHGTPTRALVGHGGAAASINRRAAPHEAAAAPAAVSAVESAENEQQRLEESKKELLSKLSTFIKRPAGASRDVTAAANPIPAMAALPKNWLPVDEVKKQSWLAKLKTSKAESLDRAKAEPAKEKAEKHLLPMSQEDLGPKVAESLGEDLDTFTQYQGTVHKIISQGLSDTTLDSFLFDEEDERQLTTYGKWQVIKHAAEQLLQVYANRSNSRWIEQESWRPPTIIDANTISSSVYANNVDVAIGAGNIALLFIDDGRLVEVNGESVAPLLSTDLWQPIKELAPQKVPAGQRLERLSVAGRHLLNAVVSIETWYGSQAVRKLKVALAVDSEQEHFMVNELQQWNFFGLHHENVALLPLPRFHGFAQDQRTRRLAHVKGSARLMLGTGYAMFLMNSPAEAYTLSADGTTPQCLAGSVLDWLRDHKATWVFTGLFSDMERLRPEALFDQDLLAAAMYAADRCGANMAMEVVIGDRERDARAYDSIVLAHGAHQETGNCNLRASAMRTVKSYQILQTQVANPHGFYLSTQRYLFKTSALQKMMVDASAFHADVRLHGFYAYATFDLGDITTFPDANCAAILAQGLKGPCMNEVVHGKTWLAYAAGILEMQDKVKEFRQKAIDVVHYEKLMQKRPDILVGSGPAVSGFKDKRGMTVVLLLSPEHTHKSARMALKMARLFIHQVVDRMHVVVVLSSSDSRDKAKGLLDDLMDKELDYNGQLLREVVTRTPEQRTSDVINEYCSRVQAELLVVPSEKLVNPAADVGGTVLSLAYLVARNITSIQVLVVKVNTIGKYAASTGVPTDSAARLPAVEAAPVPKPGKRGERRSSEANGGGRDPLVVMVHLEGAQVAPMVELVTLHMAPVQDKLFLAKTAAYEKPGQLSMRSRRVFVQARMACVAQLRVEERAYANGAPAELPKAVEAEGVDLLVVSVNGERPISKDIDELLKTVKTSVLIFRFKEAGSSSLMGMVEDI